MVHIVNSSQQVTHQALFPTGVHSRVVNLFLEFAAGLGNDDFQLTPVLGNNITLRQVKLFCSPRTPGEIGVAFIRIKTGSGTDVSSSDFLSNWEPIIANFGGIKPGFTFSGMQHEFTFNMNRLYTGESRRFGVHVENVTIQIGMRFWVSFQFTEG